jgi:hypothetical protein
MRQTVFRTRAASSRCAASLYYVLIAVACAAAVAACGSATAPSSAGSGSPAGGGSPAASHSSAAAPKVSLSITVSGSPGIPEQHWTLTCDPAGGTRPDPAAACADLLRARGPFYAQPKGLMCPMIMVSAKVATIHGTYYGQPVNTTIRDGGCGLSRWAELGQVIG